VDNDRWKAASPLLDVALELSADERVEWLASLRQKDPALALEIDGLLEEARALDSEGFLAHGPTLSAAAPATLVGQLVGAYTLKGLLGQGGMGSVWLARRSDGRFEGAVAVKFLNTALIGHAGEERFHREGNILAHLTHPHIARLIDAGVSAAGQPYLVLEYVQGERIDRYCDNQRFDVFARLRLFLDVLAAVAHAHANLIVHRDIKPSNVLVAGDANVKLLDFGIAKLLDDEAPSGEASELTRDAGRVLTPEYAAPEQLLGGAVTTATDVYALGALLFVLLTGQHPLGDPAPPPAKLIQTIASVSARRLSETVASRRTVSAEALTEIASKRAATPEKLKHLFRGDIDNIVAKALKKNPGERYASVTAFADDINHYLNHEPVSARPDSLGYRATKFVRRNRAAVIAGATAVMALAIATTIALWQLVDARAQRDEARFQAARAEASDDFSSVMLADVGAEGKPLTTLELLNRGRSLLESQYSNNPQFMASMLIQIAGRYGDLGNIDGELETMTRAEQIARRLDDPELLAQVQCNTVDTELAFQRTDRAMARMQEARAALARVAHPRVENEAACLLAEKFIADAQGDKVKAIQKAEAALRLLEGAHDTSGLQYTGILTALAKLYAETGRTKDAYEFNRRASESFDRNGRGGTMGKLITLNNEAIGLLRFGEVKRAAEVEADVIVRLQGPGEARSVDAPFAANYGQMLTRLGQLDAASRWLQYAVTKARADRDAFWEARATYFFALDLQEQGRTREAADLLTAAATLFEQNAAGNKDYLFDIALARAELTLAEGNVLEAAHHVELLLDEAGYPTITNSAKLGSALMVAARTYLQAREPAKAEALTRDALIVAERNARDPDQSADVGMALYIQAKAQDAQDENAAAQIILARAIVALRNGLGPEHAATREAAALAHRIEQRIGQRTPY
jgi:serine/threonine protein kinase/tetratricopeptide (TPR) repeat protein